MTRRPPPAPRPLSEYGDPLLLSEAAELLRCSVTHVRGLEKDGLKIVSWGMNSRVKRIFKADLAAYIQGKREAK